MLVTSKGGVAAELHLSETQMEEMIATSRQVSDYGLAEAEEELADGQHPEAPSETRFNVGKALTPLLSEQFDKLRVETVEADHRGEDPHDIVRHVLTSLTSVIASLTAENSALSKKLEAREELIKTLRVEKDAWSNSIAGQLDVAKLVKGIVTKTGTRRRKEDPLLCMTNKTADLTSGNKKHVASLLFSLQSGGTRDEYISELERVRDEIKQHTSKSGGE